MCLQTPHLMYIVRLHLYRPSLNLDVVPQTMHIRSRRSIGLFSSVIRVVNGVSMGPVNFQIICSRRCVHLYF